jgi:pheromone shutdown protein TraB
MPVDPETAAIAVVSLLGAGAVAVVTRRHYEPPPREGAEEPPEPLFETGVFAVLSAGLFVGLGYALATVGGWGALGEIATMALSLVGLYSAHATYTGRIAADADRASALVGVVSASVLGVYPPLFVTLAAL